MRRIFIIPVIAGILLTMSACGAKEETPTAAPSAKSSDSDQTTTSEKKTSTTESGDDTSDTTDDDRGSGSGSGSGDLPSGLDNDCIALSTLYVSVMAQSTSAMMPGAMSPEELEKLADELEEAGAKAEIPDELAESFEVWSTAWTEFGTIMSEMGEGGILNPANAEKLEEASKRIEDPEVEAAGKEIEAYVTENCAAGGLVEEP